MKPGTTPADLHRIPDATRAMHYMMLSHDHTKSPGRYRKGPIYVRDERRDLIVYEGPDGPQYGDSRHQTMETTLDWSYGLLGEDAKRMLRVTSIFAAPFNRDAAGYLFGESEAGLGSRTDFLLRTLIRAALLQAEEGWFTWLETFRQYGEKQLQRHGEAAFIKERFVSYLLEMAEAAADSAHGPQELHWLSRLDANRDHLRAALMVLARRHEAESRLRLATALQGFWRRRGYLEWGGDELREALASSPAPSRLRASALIALGRIIERKGDLDDARAPLDEALSIARSLDDIALEASALEASGYLMQEAGEYPGAHERLEEALEKARAAGWRWLERAVLNDLGLVTRALGQLPEAIRFFEQGLRIADEAGDVIGKGTLLNNVALTQLDEEDYERARETLEEACGILTGAREDFAVITIRLNLARVAAFEHRYDDAEAILGQAAADARRIDAGGLVAWAQQLMGWVADTRARGPEPIMSEEERRAALASAIHYYETARDLSLELGDNWRAAGNAEWAGWAAFDLADRARALRYFEEAAGLYRQGGHADDAQRIESVADLAVSDVTFKPPDLPVSEGLRRLEAVLSGAGTPRRELVDQAIRDTDVYVLGHKVDEPGEEGSSELLHFAIDRADGVEVTMLPAFTRADILREALLRNPDWQRLSVLEVNGRALLDNVDDDVHVVVNPWTPNEFTLPARRDLDSGPGDQR